jgi:hypothetical protein
LFFDFEFLIPKPLEANRIFLTSAASSGNPWFFQTASLQQIKLQKLWY